MINVCFALKSRHGVSQSRCPLSAKNGLRGSQLSSYLLYSSGFHVLANAKSFQTTVQKIAGADP
jgi:hypothetical protein